MTFLARALMVAAVFVVLPALLIGLVRRRLYQACYSFPLYVLGIWVGDILVLAWPQRFFTRSYYVVLQTAYGLLKFAVALELASLAFQAFPGAKATARRVILILLVFTLATVLFGPGLGSTEGVGQLIPHARVANGTALLFAAVWMLILWYNLPVHPFHRAILRGFVPYLLVFTVALGLVDTSSSDSTLSLFARHGDAAAYFLVLTYWAWQVWRRPQESSNPELLRKLQPWRDRLSG
jgi:hypothetical protein